MALSMSMTWGYMTPIFAEKRTSKCKRHLDESAEDSILCNPEEFFTINVFYQMLGRSFSVSQPC